MTTERSATNERTDMTPPEACAYLREIGEHKIAELIEYICSYVPSENALTECPECNIRFDPQWKEKDAAYRATLKNAAQQAERPNIEAQSWNHAVEECAKALEQANHQMLMAAVKTIRALKNAGHGDKR